MSRGNLPREGFCPERDPAPRGNLCREGTCPEREPAPRGNLPQEETCTEREPAPKGNLPQEGTCPKRIPVPKGNLSREGLAPKEICLDYAIIKTGEKNATKWQFCLVFSSFFCLQKNWSLSHEILRPHSSHRQKMS